MLSFLFLNSLKKNNKKIINKFKKYKQVLNILLDIIIKLKDKLRKLIINFYIFIFKNKNHLNLKKKKKQHLGILNKILSFLKENRNNLTLKNNLKEKKKLILSFFFKKKKFIFFDNHKFPFSHKNKINNYIGKPWKVKRFI